MVIYIRDLIVEATHGWHPHEKTQPQKFSISVEMTINSRAPETDELADTLDWQEIRDKIIAVAQNNSFNLMERLGQAIADELLGDERIKKVTVTIDKLEAFPTGTPGVKLEVSN